VNAKATKIIDEAVPVYSILKAGNNPRESWTLVADKIIAARKADPDATQREIGQRFGEGQSWVSEVITWRTKRYRALDTPFAGKINWEDRKQRIATQTPVKHADRVEMAAKLLNDPKVAKAAIKTVMDTPSPARAAIDKVMYDQRATKRQKERDWAEQRRSAAALPLPAYMARMVEKMNEWSLGLAGLYDDLDELPDGRGRELVAKAAGQLAEQAQRWVDKLEGRPDLRVIEGKASRARVSA